MGAKRACQIGNVQYIFYIFMFDEESSLISSIFLLKMFEIT